MKTILIADDSAFMRLWLKRIIEQHDSYKVIGEACDGKEAIAKFQQYKPFVVLLDMTMNNMDGLTALKEIMKVDHTANVIMCSAMGTKQNVTEAIACGAKNFIVKPHFDGLMEAIEKCKN